MSSAAYQLAKAWDAWQTACHEEPFTTTLDERKELLDHAVHLTAYVLAHPTGTSMDEDELDRYESCLLGVGMALIGEQPEVSISVIKDILDSAGMPVPESHD